MTCSCQKLNYLGEHRIPHRHFLMMNFETGSVTLWASWGKIGNPLEYLARYYERNYGAELAPEPA